MDACRQAESDRVHNVGGQGTARSLPGVRVGKGLGLLKVCDEAVLNVVEPAIVHPLTTARSRCARSSAQFSPGFRACVRLSIDKRRAEYVAGLEIVAP